MSIIHRAKGTSRVGYHNVYWWVSGSVTGQQIVVDFRNVDTYTRKNAQVVTGLQTSCYKSVHKLSTSCVRTACSQLL
jgi:hypothetical protein